MFCVSQISTGVRLVASMFDVFLTTRTNLKVGIPDKVAYMFGDALIITTASMLAGMPAVLLTAKVCPKGYESTTYALLAGFQNFGRSVSQSIGVYLIYFLGIRTSVADSIDGHCNFDKLPLLVFISHFVFPLVTIPLTFILLPGSRINEDIDLDFSKFPPLAPDRARERSNSDSSTDDDGHTAGVQMGAIATSSKVDDDNADEHAKLTENDSVATHSELMSESVREASGTRRGVRAVDNDDDVVRVHRRESFSLDFTESDAQ